MSKKVSCYLRTHRRRWGLTQKELGRLLPGGSRRRVSLVEREITAPKATELLAYAFLFGVPPRAIFPRFTERMVEGVIERAAQMSKALENDGSALAEHKHGLLRLLPDRPLFDIGDKPTDL